MSDLGATPELEPWDCPRCGHHNVERTCAFCRYAIDPAGPPPASVETSETTSGTATGRAPRRRPVAGIVVAAIVVALLAAVDHRLADILELLEGSIGRAKKIIVSGGILQSPASLQLLADSLGRDFEVCADQEASLRGAAVHALEHFDRKIAPPKFQHRIRHNHARTRKARKQRARQKALEALFYSWNFR